MIYRWNLSTTLELLDLWERTLFNVSVAAIAGFSTFYSYKFISTLRG